MIIENSTASSNIGSDFASSFIEDEEDFLSKKFIEYHTNASRKDNFIKICSSIEFIKKLKTLINNGWSYDDFILLNPNCRRFIVPELQKYNLYYLHNQNYYDYIEYEKNKCIKILPMLFDSDISAIILKPTMIPKFQICQLKDDSKNPLYTFHEIVSSGAKIQIDAFSHNEKLMQDILNNPPQWLETEKKLTTEEQKRIYLLSQINLKIYQKINLAWDNVEKAQKVFKIIG